MNKISIRTPRKIANKIILLVLSLEFISILLWGILTYSGSRDELIKTKSSQLSEVAFRTTNEIGNFFLPVLIELDVISAAFTSDLNKVNTQSDKLLYRLLNTRFEIEEVSVIDKNGKELRRVSRMRGFGDIELRHFGNDKLFQDAMLGEHVTGPITFSEYLEPKIRIATPIISNVRDEQALITVVNLKWLWDTVQSLRVGESGYVYVVDESLKLVAHTDPSLVLSGLNLAQSTVPLTMFVGDVQQELLIYKSLDGEEVAGVSRFDPVHRWWVIVEQPVAEGLAPLDRVIKRFILAFLLATILTIITVVYFSKLMMRPLESLEKAITRLEGGDRNVRADVPKYTELSSLSVAFNKMADSLNEKTRALEYQAHYDVLTKLPNRKLLFEYLDDKLKTASANKKSFFLLLLDLDRFKEINDSLGHKVGDLLLKQLGGRLLKMLPKSDLVARLGGDEFALVLESADSIKNAVIVAGKVRAVVQEHFELEGMRLLVDASIGIATYPLHGNNSGVLMRRADVAMYYAKKAGIGVAVYNEDNDINTPQRLALISGLPRAIKEDELVLHYQPKIRVSDRQVTGVEALVRWDHPEHGLLPPDQFVPIVELGDSIIALTDWVINRALTDFKTWQDHGLKFNIAVNVSILNIQDRKFLNKLNELILRHRVDPMYLQLELTESVIMADTTRTQETIETLDAMGISVSIDDFGTGYSSLAYLKKLPVADLKIDKSFVMDMEKDDNDAVIVRSTIDLAHNLGMKVTAEGVESAETLNLLDILDCDNAQGYHICRPIPMEQILPWVKRWQEANTGHLDIHVTDDSKAV